jgi:hypothetical protein
MSSSSLGVWELMCSPGAMRKCSVTVVGLAGGNGDLLGVEVLDGRGLESGMAGKNCRLRLGLQARQSDGDPKAIPDLAVPASICPYTPG